ncbi:GAF domain-containing protein [Fontibacillus panacisegetis]|uniref:GAF domain-containing protein n=1 Tax=Fontibacillus panacisegetis TaxID=670482 RepID=A0A1G7V6N5_9BACL|nr:helix-turn-helix domain-containing protein [Fontibacillus panacisegetis]SDG55161.1 GAF domain-containing protein [Fontibacillus panacisegetis]
MEEYITRELKNADFQLWAGEKGQPFQLLASKGQQKAAPPETTSAASEASFLEAHEELGCTDLHLRYPTGLRITVRCFDFTNPDADKLLERLSASLPPYYIEYVISRQSDTLHKMNNSIQSVTSLLDLDKLLSEILNNTMAVIPTATTGVLWMYDEEEDVLKVRTVSEQLVNETMGLMRMKPGEGMIGKAFLEGIPRAYHSFEAISRAASNMSENNLNYFQASHSHDFADHQGVLCVPVKVNGKPECVLILYQFGSYPLFTDYDFVLLQNFADQVAIAIQNARLFSEVQRQNQMLVKRDEIHARLMKLSLRNKGTAVILRELEKMIGMQLIFIDLIEYAVTASNKKARASVSIAAIERKFSSRREPATYEEETATGIIRRHVVPIFAADATLGFVIIELPRELSVLNRLILEQGSSILSLEMVRKQSQADYYHKKANDRFNELLSLQDISALRRKGEEMGLIDEQKSCAIIFNLLPLPGVQLMNVQIYRLIVLVKKTFQQKAAVVFALDNRLTAIVQITDDESEHNLKEHLTALFKEWSQYGDGTLRAGVGSSFTGLKSLAGSYAEANKALTYLLSKKRSGYMYYPEIGVNQLFLQQSSEDLEAFVYQVIGPLRDSGSNGSRLEETLMAYVRTNRSIQQTAEHLHIHVNTLYQRLKKIEDTLHLSLKEPEHMLRLELACYLLSRSSDELT